MFRFNSDGTLDTSFGDGGRVGPNFGGGFTAIVLQPDGKLVAAGLAGEVPATDFLLVRFNPDGSLDTSFGSGGLVVTDFGKNSRADALVLQADGKLVAGGTLFRRFVTDFIVARYQPDGSLDASFGSGGIVRTRLGGSGFGLQALVLQADGKLVAAGDSNPSGDLDFALARYVTTDEPLAMPPKCGGRRATILGTSRKDAIRDTRGPDVILGLGGNDTIRGLGGNDTICGGPGLDTLIGNEGNDRLLGQGQSDKLLGTTAATVSMAGAVGTRAVPGKRCFGAKGRRRLASGPRTHPSRRVRRSATSRVVSPVPISPRRIGEPVAFQRFRRTALRSASHSGALPTPSKSPPSQGGDLEKLTFLSLSCALNSKSVTLSDTHASHRENAA